MLWDKQQPKILIIEDRLNNHQLFTDVFSQAGFAVTIRQNADGEFANEVADLKPDVISMDIMIAKIGKDAERDGFEAIDVLKNDDRTKHIPIIVLSNLFEESNVARAKDLGALDYINLQGQSLPEVADRFWRFLEKPNNYHPSHPLFQ